MKTLFFHDYLPTTYLRPTHYLPTYLYLPSTFLLPTYYLPTYLPNYLPTTLPNKNMKFQVRGVLGIIWSECKGIAKRASSICV